jgi:hypothetical protein
VNDRSCIRNGCPYFSAHATSASTASR